MQASFEPQHSGEQDLTIRTHADLIVDYLIQLDVEYVFGVPGGAIEPLYNAIAKRLRESAQGRPLPAMHPYLVDTRKRRNSRAPRPIVARHEAGAAFMAEGYTRETGKLGVCCATTGPGATNLITGVASAFTENMPMLVITPQTALPNHGRASLQESSCDGIDIVGMFEHCTRYNTLVSHPDQLEGKIFQALITAFRRPRGPVHLSIPMDILTTPLVPRANYQVTPQLREQRMDGSDSTEKLTEAMCNARKIVFYLGRTCSRAISTLIQIAETLNASIVTSPTAKGMIRSDHPLYRGVFGFAGHASARQALIDPEVDLILAIETEFSELSTAGWDHHALMNSKLIHIDSNVENFSRSPMARLHVFGDPLVIARAIKERLGHPTDNPPHKTPPLNPDTPNILLDKPNMRQCADTPLKPQRVMTELAKHLPEDTRYVIDAGNVWAWSTHYLPLRHTNHFHIGMGFGAMAWGIGAAIGIALGNRQAPVVCLTGDGSWLMSAQEITVAVQQQLPVVFIVLNDQALGMVKHGQRMGGAERIGFELPPIDYAAMGRSMGAIGITIKAPEDFEEIDFRKLFLQNKPTLIDIYIDGEETPPMGSRVKILQLANEKKQ